MLESGLQKIGVRYGNGIYLLVGQGQYLLVGQGHYRVSYSSTLKILITPRYCPLRSILRAPSCSPPPNYCTQIFTWWVYHTFCKRYFALNQPHRVVKKNLCPYEHPWSRTNNLSTTPSPPPSALVDDIVGIGNVPLPPAISSSRLHGAHHHVTALSSLHVVIDTTCINSHITSNNYFFSSSNDVDPLHMMLVDCCMLCCRGCGPIAAV